MSNTNNSRKYCHKVRLTFFPDHYVYIWRDNPPTEVHDCCKTWTKEKELEWQANDKSWLYTGEESDSEPLPDIDSKEKKN